MAAKKLLRLVSGRIQEIVATVISGGVANDGDIPALDGTGRLDVSVMPVGIVADTVSATATEAISSGDFVNLFLNGGVLSCRKADATAAGKEANGYSLAAISSSAVGAIHQDSTNTALSGLTIGATYYLSAATPGGVVTTPPSSTGNVVQVIGKATSATALHFEPNDGVILA